ncbi:hypothetical protein CF328_g9222, partial [Tilletia controversa]
ASSSKTPFPPSDPSAPDAEQEGTGGDGGGELGGSDKGKSTTRLRTRRSDASSAELTAAIAAMSSRQLAAADKAREQQQQQHDETLRLADKARALQRQEHRERLAMEDRRLDLEERALKGKEKQEDRVSSLEDEVKQLGAAVTEAGNTSKQVLDYLKDKLQYKILAESGSGAQECLTGLVPRDARDRVAEQRADAVLLREVAVQDPLILLDVEAREECWDPADRPLDGDADAGHLEVEAGLGGGKEEALVGHDEVAESSVVLVAEEW